MKNNLKYVSTTSNTHNLYKRMLPIETTRIQSNLKWRMCVQLPIFIIKSRNNLEIGEIGCLLMCNLKTKSSKKNQKERRLNWLQNYNLTLKNILIKKTQLIKCGNIEVQPISNSKFKIQIFKWTTYEIRELG